MPMYDATDPTLRIERHLPLAPPDAFDVFIRPAHMPRLWGHGARGTVDLAGLRQWHVVEHRPPRAPAVFRGIVVEAVRPKHFARRRRVGRRWAVPGEPLRARGAGG